MSPPPSLKDEDSFSSSKSDTATLREEIIWKLFFVVAIVGIILLIRIFWILHKIRQQRRRQKEKKTTTTPRSSSSSSSSSATTTNDTNSTTAAVAAAADTTGMKITRSEPAKTMVVLGSGGHTTEMLQLIKNLDPKFYTPFVVVVASTDTTSISRVEAYPHPLPINIGRNIPKDQDVKNKTKTEDPPSPPLPPSKVYKIPRSREVGQSYSSSVGTTLYSFIFAMRMVMIERPDLILINGPGTCLPVAVSAFLLKIVGYKSSCKIVFVESFCRVKRYVTVVLSKTKIKYTESQFPPHPLTPYRLHTYTYTTTSPLFSLSFGLELYVSSKCYLSIIYTVFH